RRIMKIESLPLVPPGHASPGERVALRDGRRFRRINASWTGLATSPLRRLLLARAAPRRPEPRQHEGHPRPALGRRAGRDAAPVRLDDRAGDRQAKAGAALPAGAGGVGAVEPVEDAVALVLGDPGAVVLDR